MLKSCRADPIQVMAECLFYPHLRINHDFSRMSLPFQVNLHNSNYAVGFIKSRMSKNLQDSGQSYRTVMCDLRGEHSWTKNKDSGAGVEDKWPQDIPMPGVSQVSKRLKLTSS